MFCGRTFAGTAEVVNPTFCEPVHGQTSYQEQLAIRNSRRTKKIAAARQTRAAAFPTPGSLSLSVLRINVFRSSADPKLPFGSLTTRTKSRIDHCKSKPMQLSLLYIRTRTRESFKNLHLGARFLQVRAGSFNTRAANTKINERNDS